MICASLYQYINRAFDHKQGTKIEGFVLNRVYILGIFCPKQGQDFKPSAAPLYPNNGWVPPSPPGEEDVLPVYAIIGSTQPGLFIIWMKTFTFIIQMTFNFLRCTEWKKMVYLGDGDIWLQLRESFSNLGSHVSGIHILTKFLKNFTSTSKKVFGKIL